MAAISNGFPSHSFLSSIIRKFYNEHLANNSRLSTAGIRFIRNCLQLYRAGAELQKPRQAQWSLQFTHSVFWTHISDSWISFAIGRIVTLDAAVFPVPPGYGNSSDWPHLAVVQPSETVVNSNLFPTQLYIWLILRPA